jgi:hypothetical protein
MLLLDHVVLSLFFDQLPTLRRYVRGRPVRLYSKSLLQNLQYTLAIKPAYLRSGNQAVSKPMLFVPGAFGFPMIAVAFVVKHTEVFPIPLQPFQPLSCQARRTEMCFVTSAVICHSIYVYLFLLDSVLNPSHVRAK